MFEIYLYTFGITATFHKSQWVIPRNILHVWWYRFLITFCTIPAGHITSFTWKKWKRSQIAKFMGLTLDPPGSCRPQMGPMLTPWTSLSGMCSMFRSQNGIICKNNGVMKSYSISTEICVKFERFLETYATDHVWHAPDLYLLTDKTSYRKTSRSFKAKRHGFRDWFRQAYWYQCLAVFIRVLLIHKSTGGVIELDQHWFR